MEPKKQRKKSTLKELASMASQNDIDLVKSTLGIQSIDEDLLLKALNDYRGLQASKQDKIEIKSILLSGAKQGDLRVTRGFNKEHLLYIYNDRKWYPIKAEAATTFGTMVTPSRRNSTESNEPSRVRNTSFEYSASNILYTSGWFAVNNNTTYLSGTSTGFAACDIVMAEIKSIQVFFSTAATDTTMYNMIENGTAEGVGMKIVTNRISLRTGSDYITKYWNGSSFVSATSGYLKVVVS